MTGLSVVIPNWNGRALLEAHLPAVLEELDRVRAAGRAAELIVVDDGSTDGSAAWLRRAHPQVRVIERVNNGGFAAACNLGVRAAAHEAVYLLNSDAAPGPGALVAALETLAAPDVFAVASLEEAGWWPMGHLRGGRLAVRYVRAPLAQPTEALFASGGHSLFRRAMFLELGGFDEGYAPFYWEDIDLAWRARRRGRRILLDPRSRIRHAGGGSIPRAAGRIRRWAIRRRNAARFSLRHLATGADRETARAWLSRLSAAAPAGVLYLSEHGHFGGAEQSLLALAAGLDRGRFRPVVACGEDGPILARFSSAGVEARVVELPRLRSIPGFRASARAVWRVARVARDEHIRVIHGNSTRANGYAWLAGRLSGARVVWHARNLSHPRFPDVERRLARLPDAVVANSRAVAARFGGRADMVYNGIDLDRFRPGRSGTEFRRTLGVANGAPLVGLVGRIGIGKGHEPFLRAMADLAARVPGVRGVVVGAALTPLEIPMQAVLEALADELGLAGRVTFAGWRDDLEDVYAGLDVVVSATDAEPFGRVLVEAMACARPVVAVRSGGAPEVVEDGVTGRLAAAGDPGALAAAIGGILSHPDEAAAMGREGRRRAERLFSAAGMVRGIEAVYARVLAD